MRTPFIRTLVPVAAGIALVVGGTSTAQAADYYLDGFQTETRGTGSATADTDVDRDLNFRAAADVTGGTRFLIPILNLLPYSNPSEASARTLASDAVPGVTGPGEYLVTVEYSGVATEVSETGNGQARTEVFAQVTYQTGLEQFGVLGQDSVEPTADGTVTLEFEIDVPEDAAPGIGMELRAFAQANGDGNAASAEIIGQLTSVNATPIG